MKPKRRWRVTSLFATNVVEIHKQNELDAIERRIDAIVTYGNEKQWNALAKPVDIVRRQSPLSPWRGAARPDHLAVKETKQLILIPVEDETIGWVLIGLSLDGVLYEVESRLVAIDKYNYLTRYNFLLGNLSRAGLQQFSEALMDVERYVR